MTLMSVQAVMLVLITVLARTRKAALTAFATTDSLWRATSATTLMNAKIILTTAMPTPAVSMKLVHSDVIAIPVIQETA